MEKIFWMLILRWILAGLIAGFSFLFYPLLAPLTLRVSYGILRFFTEARLDGSLIFVDGTALEFIPACVALSAYILLAILVLLTGGISISKRITLLFYGSLLIFIANILRIELLISVLLLYGKNYFQTLHLVIWKFVASIYVAFIWIFLTWRFKIHTIPIYSDIQTVMHAALRKK